MFHHIYQTEAIVLGSRVSGESNRLFFLFTKELGFIVAMAQGIRELKSKLRFSLQDFGSTRVCMVRGKELWRITNAEPVNGYHSIFSNPKNVIFLTRIFLLLRRLLHGEERNEELFRAVSEMMHFLENEELSGKELLALEIAMNLKILHHLGYGTDREMYRVFIMMPPSKSVLNEIDAVKSQALADINAALKESHL